LGKLSCLKIIAVTCKKDLNNENQILKQKINIERKELGTRIQNKKTYAHKI
jgi:hypothetical protein